MTDAAHHLLGLQGLVVEDEGDAAPHHLQPARAVEHRAALPHDGHWKAERQRSELHMLQTSAGFHITFRTG